MIIFDIEVKGKNNKIVDIGALTNNNHFFHSNSMDEFDLFIRKNNPSFFAGHNIVSFDIEYLKNSKVSKYFSADNVVDTLYLSALFFPKFPRHNLLKDDKIVSEYINNPFNDAKKSFDLLNDSINEFNKLDNDMKIILYYLTNKVEGIEGFYKYIQYKPRLFNGLKLITTYFRDKICSSKNLKQLINKYPLELAFVLSYLNTDDINKSLLPAWILNNFPKVENVLTYLRSTPCNKKCNYCDNNLSAVAGLKKYFKYDAFRDFNGVNLQEDAVNSALNNESLLAIFPTGGGKSLTFQLPALLSGEKIAGLTVVISPLQALMKDQVDGLYDKGINEAGYINGLLSPGERKNIIERVLDGSINILYLSPEALRSRAIRNLLLKRQVIRFVIDEAHCFSTWGHDFRVDYLYIGDFIKELSEKKELTSPIPVSCFTATAKQDVVNDIVNYFKDKLGLKMKFFTTTSGRTNLKYHVRKVTDDTNRYMTLRNILESDNRPTIVYTSRTKVVDDLHHRLTRDNFKVSKFHGRLDTADKVRNQNEFMEYQTNIMIATNAFGMGVDKNDVGNVIHYTISDSIENYVQEAGRAGRDPKDVADCYILYNKDDLQQHFDMLNRSKVSPKEISQIWKGIKNETNQRDDFTKTALEIARFSGWDETSEIETRVKTSILALEDSKFIHRGLNSPRVFATSLLVKNFEEANKLITKSTNYSEEEKVLCRRIVSSLLSTKYKSWDLEVAESRVDYLSDNLGISISVIIKHVNILKDLNIIADDGDLFAKIGKDTVKRTLTMQLNRYQEFVIYLINSLDEEQKQYNIKKLNEDFEGNYKQNISFLNSSLNYLVRAKFVSKKMYSKDYFIAYLNKEKEVLIKEIENKFKLAHFIVDYLINKYNTSKSLKYDNLVDFSSIEITKEYQRQQGLFGDNTDFKEVESAVLMLQILGVISFEGGFLVVYSPMYIKRLALNNSTQYTLANYSKLKNHYNIKNQQIHIVGRYAELMHENPDEANIFVSDYFNIDYKKFIDKYYPGKESRELDYKMSKSRFEKLFGSLSKEQMDIIKDDKSKVIGVAAGPGSGKTTLLVHKLASIIYNEDVRSEQLLMLTFSRNAATEFRERLKALIGNVANYITITTFHSFAFDLIGRQGSLEHSENIVLEALELIRSGEADSFKLTKMMLVIDEAQDMRDHEYELVQELIKHNEDMRVIAVGDDDQNIYEFRKSNSKYLMELSKDKKYELSTNFRSKKLLVNYSNKFIENNKNRLKTNVMKSSSNEQGEINIVTYENPNLIDPLINDYITSKRKGTSAIITTTNDEALVISGILTDKGIDNTLVQNLDAYRPFNIYEIREFYNMLESKTISKIDIRDWEYVFNEFEERFKTSKTYNLSMNLLNKFIEVYSDPYLSDFKEYLLQSDLFIEEDKVIVANMHKVKGLEFDNVYLLYEKNTFKYNDVEKRAIYVAITRAKSSLSIHTTNNIFESIKINNINYYIDKNKYIEPTSILMSFDLKKVHLDFYEPIRNNVTSILPGDKLEIDNTILKFSGKNVGRLSRRGFEELKVRLDNGYKITNIEVQDLVYWYNQEREIELLIMIPALKVNKNLGQ